MIVPQTHNKHHPRLERLTHRRHSSAVRERRRIAKERLLGLAEGVGDGIVLREAGEGGVGVVDDFAVLDVEAFDLAQIAAGGDELGDDGHLGHAVHGLACQRRA